jgi:hypothetical protein
MAESIDKILPQNLYENKEYLIRARAVNAFGNASEWSDSLYIDTSRSINEEGFIQSTKNNFSVRNNDGEIVFGAFTVKEQRQNLVKNPSFEVSTVGWESIGSTMLSLSDSGDSFTGLISAKLTVATAAKQDIGFRQEAADYTAVSAGEVYTASAHVFRSYLASNHSAPSDQSKFDIKLNYYNNLGTLISTNMASQPMSTSHGIWSRISLRNVVIPVGVFYIGVEVSYSDTNSLDLDENEFALVDGVLLEELPTLNMYFDGSVISGITSWDGADHLSISLFDNINQNTVYIKGNITADTGAIGPLTIESTKVYLGTGDYNNTNTPFYIDEAGQFSIGNKLMYSSGLLTIDGGGTFSGDLSAAGGTFSGDLSAAGGTFSGDLSAAGGTFSGNLSAAGGTFSGNLSAAGGTFSGYLSAAGGSFSGDITASSGTFSGTLSASSGTIGGWTINSSDISSLSNRISLQDTGIITIGSSANSNIKLTGGSNGAATTFTMGAATSSTSGTGVFMDGGGNFRFGSTTNYVRYLSGSVAIETPNFKVDAGGTVKALNFNLYEGSTLRASWATNFKSNGATGLIFGGAGATSYSLISADKIAPSTLELVSVLQAGWRESEVRLTGGGFILSSNDSGSYSGINGGGGTMVVQASNYLDFRASTAYFNGAISASGDISTGGYFRVVGGRGWVNDSYGTGMYSGQTNWVRTYGTNTGIMSNTSYIAYGMYGAGGGTLNVRKDSTYGVLVVEGSTRDMKENVQTLQSAESGRIIDMLRPVTYTLKYRSLPDGHMPLGIPDTSEETADQLKLREWDVEYGFIAEEIDAFEPEGVTLTSYDWGEISEDGFPKPVGWKQSNVTAILVAEVKELRKRLAALEQVAS